MRRLVGVLLVLVVASACAPGGSSDQVTIRVFAASSLSESFTTLAHRFERDHPGVRVQLSFGPSSGLAEQIRQGAPADVFAAASTSTMQEVVQSGDARSPRDFAVNTLEVAVPPDNPAHVRALADLGRSQVKVALCQPQVPCGAVAAEVLDKAGVTVKPATEEIDVKSVLTKVRLGEVDAGLVYVTDVRAAGQEVRGIRIPESVNARTTYPLAALGGSGHPGEARQFVALVLSAEGRRVLAHAGFEAP